MMKGNQLLQSDLDRFQGYVKELSQHERLRTDTPGQA